MHVRPLDRDSAAEVDLVAARMRLTLIEVLGSEVGAELYTLDWLRARVRWHLDPTQCTGEAFVADDAGAVLGHTIVRVQGEEDGQRVGLFATTYVDPAARRRGIADALIEAGEAWLGPQDVTTLATDTSETNERLIRLFEKHGYAIALRVPEKQMIRLAKPYGP